jgi:hypothetical protein
MNTKRLQGSNAMTRALLFITLVLGLTQGCAEPVEDINTIHTQYLPKTMFEGTWYYRQMVVGSDPTVSWGAMIGFETDTEKVVWEVRENLLLAYRSHEGFEGIDEDDTQPGARYRGEPIAAFDINGHYDIERGYNAQTGEQSNRISTNTSDRPWFERDYITINFRSEVGSPTDATFGYYFSFVDQLSEGRWDDAYRYSPDQPIFERDYMEFTNVREILDDFSCWYLYGESGACSGGTVKLRHSFRRVDENAQKQYDPRPYDDVLPVNEGDSLEGVRTTLLPYPLPRLVGGRNPELACEADDECPQYPNDGLSSSCIQGFCRSFIFGRTNADARTYRDANGWAEASSECETSTDCVFGLGCVEGQCSECFGNGDCADGEVCIRGLDEGRTRDFRVNGGECSLPYVEMECNSELYTALDNLFAPGYFDDINCSESSIEQLDRFGFFRAERPGYNRETGTNRDEDRNYLANIHDIWQQSFETASDGTPDQSKPIPIKDRQPKPIVYHLSVGFPEDLTAANVQVMKDWNAAMMSVVKAATGRSDATIADQLTKYGEQQPGDHLFLEGDDVQHGGMYQLRENNCSFRGLDAYLKRHPEYFGLVEGAAQANERNPAAEFATTGRKYTASLSTELKAVLLPGAMQRICASLTRATLDDGVRNDAGDLDPFRWQKLGDLRYSFLAWIHDKQPDGPLGYGPSSSDGETGQVIVANANIYGASLDSYARAAVDWVRAFNGDLSTGELIDGVNARNWLKASRSVADQRMGLKKGDVDASKLNGLKTATARDGVLSPIEFNVKKLATAATDFRESARQVSTRAQVSTPGQARMERIMADPIASQMLVPEEIRTFVDATHRHRPDEDAEHSRDEAAKDYVGNLRRFHTRADERQRMLDHARVDTFDMVDNAIIGKALELKGRDPEELYLELREEVYRAVTLHEIGHTMGLTHNFAGSFDAMNFQDDYWKIINETPPGDGADDDALDDRVRQRLPEFMYSSIMDYHGRFNSDDQGLGKYDVAAVKFAYARTLEVFEDSVELPNFALTGLYTQFVWGNSSLPNVYGETVANLSKRKDVPIEEIRQGRLDSLRQNAAKSIESIYDSEVTGFSATREVPYQFCEHAYEGNVGCRMFDQGASHPEIVTNAIQQYWNYYYFNNFRRGAREMSFYDRYFGLQARLMRDLTYPIRYLVYTLNREAYAQTRQDTLDPIQLEYLEASYIALNYINQVLGTPVPGRHCLDATSGTYVFDPNSARCDDPIDIADGDGRQPYIKFNDERETLEIYRGGRIDYIGSFYDKWNVLFYLMDDSTQFFNVTDFGDSRRFSINYYRLFPEQITSMMRDLVFNHLGIASSRVIGPLIDADGEVQLPRVEVPWINGAERPTGTPIATEVPRALAFQALLMSSVFNSSPFDQEFDFMERMLVFEEGSGEARTLDPDTEIAAYVDPLTRVRYLAPQTLTRDSISHELLTYFRQYADDVFEPARDAYDADPTDEAVRAEYEAAKLRVGRFGEFVNDLRWIRVVTEPYFD